MVSAEPLNEAEEVLWRSLMWLGVTLSRTMSEVSGSAGLSGAKYALLMHLSEAPDRRLRMSDLADRMAFSAGRITRMVAEMVDGGMIKRLSDSSDGRSRIAELTDDGFDTVVEMHPVIVASARRLVFDHLDACETQHVGQVLERIVGVVEVARSTAIRRQ